MTTNLLHLRHNLAWLAEVAEWTQAELARRQISTTGSPVEVRVLPWSAVLRFPTTDGPVYFKACAPSQAFEPALMRYLAERRPDDVLPALAADLARAWLLLPDGGPVLRYALREDTADVVHHWSAILPRLAAIQVDLTGDAGRLLALGVPNRRPAVLPALYRDILARTDLWPLDEAGGLSAADLPRLHALAPRVDAVCGELAARGPADTLVHDDLHDGHIFVRMTAEGDAYRFFDYGDACVGHPFFQMIAPQGFYSRAYEDLELSAAETEALYEIYMAGWSPDRWRDGGTPTERRRTLQLALAAGPLIRALTWVNALGPHRDDIPANLRAIYAQGMAHWLNELDRRTDELSA